MASTMPTHFKFKFRNHHPRPNGRLGGVAVRPMRIPGSPTSSFRCNLGYSFLRHRIFNPSSGSDLTVLTRVSSDGGGIADAASRQSASAVGSELLLFRIFLDFYGWN